MAAIKAQFLHWKSLGFGVVAGLSTQTYAMITSPRLICASVLFVAASIQAADWPQWRGPNRDSVGGAKNHPLNKLPEDPKVLWKIDAGPGQSSPVVSNGKLVYTDATETEELAHCL